MDRAVGGGQHGLSDQPGLEHVHESTLNDAYPSAPTSDAAPAAGQNESDTLPRGTKRSRSASPPLLSPAHSGAPEYINHDASHPYADETFADAYAYVREPDAFTGNEMEVEVGTGVGEGREGSEVLGMGETELREEVFRLREQVRMFQEGGSGGDNASNLAVGGEQDAEAVYGPEDGLENRDIEQGQIETLDEGELGINSGPDRDRDGDMQDAAQTLGQIATIALEHSAMYGSALSYGADQQHLDAGMLLDEEDAAGDSCSNELLREHAGSPSDHPLDHDDGHDTNDFAANPSQRSSLTGGTTKSRMHNGTERPAHIRELPEERQSGSTYLHEESVDGSNLDDRQQAHLASELGDGRSSGPLDDQEPSLEDMGLTLAHAADHEMHLAGIGAEMGLNFNLGINMGGPSSAHGTSEYPFGLSIDALGAVVAPDEPPRKKRRTAKRSAFDIDANGKGPLPVPRAEVPISFQTGKRLIIRDRTDALARSVRAVMREEWGRLEVDPLPGPDEGGPDWSKGPRHPENIAYQDRIARTLLTSIENGTCRLEVPPSQQDFPMIQLAAQTSFLNFSKRYSYQVSDDAKKKQMKIAKRGRRWARKDLKQRKRSRAASTMDDVPAHLLKIDYMSSEDSSEGEESGYPEGLWDEYAAATGRANEEEKVLEIKTPRWRSADLQAIYDRVDEVATHHVDALKGKGHMAPPMRRFKMPELRQRRPPLDATETWMYVDGIVPSKEDRGKPTPAYKMPRVPKERAARGPKEPRAPKVPKAAKAPKEPKEPKAPKAPRKRKAKQRTIDDISGPAGSPEAELPEGPTDVDGMEEGLTMDNSLAALVQPTAAMHRPTAEEDRHQSSEDMHIAPDMDSTEILLEPEPYLEIG